MTLPDGTRLGPYEVVGPVGAGGMGEVYRARDTRLNRDVALKVLPHAFAADADRVLRFEREAQSLAALNHPHIAQIHGLQEGSPDGRQQILALVMEFVQGESLDAKIARGPLAPSVAIDLARQLIDALDASHSAGIIHRDLKPANIRVTPDGLVKVVDFGLAKAMDANAGPDESETRALPADVTERGVVVGTARYMSPEQARGLRVDKRTDIWAFGCVLFEMVTARPAFQGATWHDAISAVLEREPDWTALPASTPPRLQELIRNCLIKDLRRRLRDIADARLTLIDDGGVTATSPSRPLLGRSVVPWALAGVSLLALAVVAQRPAPTAAATAPPFGRVVRFTSGPALELSPVVSPDGKWVTYFSNVRGPMDIWVKYVAGGEAVNLTASATLQLPTRVDIGGLAISPDGASIAFDAGAAPGTPSNLFDSWVIPAPLGGIPRKVIERGRGLRWSPDGRYIAYIHPGSSAGDALYLADADGGNAREIVGTRGGMHTHWLAWGHDSRHIYFNYSVSTSNSEPSELYRVAVSGGALEPVVTTARRAVFAMPLADGDGLLYAANPDTADLGLWWRSLTDSTIPPVRVTKGVGEYAEPSVSRDSQFAVATLVEIRQTLLRIPPGTPGATAMTALTDGSTGDTDPTVSPDGKTVVFSSTRAGNRTLWMMPTAGGGARPLTSGTVFDERPVFSPDGTRMAFVSDRGGRRGIWVMNAGGGAPRLVAHAQMLEGISWSPDGQQLVYASPVGDLPGLSIVAVADGTTRPLPTPGPAAAPVWSPRGDLIAYVEARRPEPDKPSSSQIAFIDPTGKPVAIKSIPGPNVLNGFLAWSPNGRDLAAIVDPGAASGAIWTADITRDRAFRLVYEGAPGVRFRGAAWLPDGAGLLVGELRRNSDVVLLERSQ